MSTTHSTVDHPDTNRELPSITRQQLRVILAGGSALMADDALNLELGATPQEYRDAYDRHLTPRAAANGGYVSEFASEPAVEMTPEQRAYCRGRDEGFVQGLEWAMGRCIQVGVGEDER